MPPKIRSDIILRQLQKRHLERKLPDVFFAEVKNGPTWTNSNLLILDAVAIKKSWSNPCIIGYEVKVSRGDFVRDEKWHGYLKYCHQFNFVCPVGLIKTEELPPEVGLIYYNNEKDCLSTKRKALHRAIEMSWEMLYYLAISRTDSDRHPFFSEKREYLEAWVQNKSDGRSLGQLLGSKMSLRIDELLERVRDLERKLKSQEGDLNRFEVISGILAQHGIYAHRHDIEGKLEEVLGGKMPVGFTNSLEIIEREIKRLTRGLGGQGVRRQ